MHKFLRNLVISAIVLICWLALYQVRMNTEAVLLPGIDSISTWVITYTGISFVPTVFFTSGTISNGDLISVYLSSSDSSGSLWTYVATGTLTAIPYNLWAPWTGTITMGTGFYDYTGSNLYLHAFVTNGGWANTWYLMQAITFISGAGWGMSDADRAALYTGTIYSAVLSGGINSNLNTVTASNVTWFSWLYFEAPGSGKLVLLSSLNLESGAVQDFLQHIPLYLEINDGFVSFNPTGSGAALNVNAQIYMYYSPSLSIPSTIDDDINNIIVRDLSGNILASSGMVSSFVCGLSGLYNICGFTAPHFTSFEMRPRLTSVKITSNNTNTSYAKSWNVVTLSFTGSEILSWIVVKINWSTAWVTVTGSNTNWVATKTMGAWDGLIAFTIDYYNLSGWSLYLSWLTVTWTTNSSSVTLDNTLPTLSWAAAVTNLTSQTPRYSFTGSEGGTISYTWGGTCTSINHPTTASSWLNNMTFNALSNATYSWCQFKVTDVAGNPSSWLTIPTFTVNYTAPSGGGGGGTSWTGEVTTWTITHLSWSIVGSTFSLEFNNAYLYAYDIGITTMNTIQKADMTWVLIRAHMAKMMVNYAIKVLGKYPNASSWCTFNDIADQSTEMKNYIKRSCQLGLMWVGMTNFEPNTEVTRAQFGTVLSRALYGEQYNWWTPYYLNHLNALQIHNIITNTDPDLQEIRWYVMLMLFRAQ